MSHKKAPPATDNPPAGVGPTPSELAGLPYMAPAPMEPPAEMEKTGEAPKDWDRICTFCGSKCMPEAAREFDHDVYECVNRACRATYGVKSFYGNGGIFIREEFEGIQEGPLNG